MQDLSKNNKSVTDMDKHETIGRYKIGLPKIKQVGTRILTNTCDVDGFRITVYFSKRRNY